MKDEDKTKEQLIQELLELRKQLAKMGWQAAKTEEVSPGDGQSTLGADNIEATYGAEEPWLSIETKLVAGSVVAGLVALLVLAILVHMFLLGGQ